MRQLPFITVGKILNELRDEGVIVSRATFYRLEKRLGFRGDSNPNKWRTYSEDKAYAIKTAIKDYYKISESFSKGEAAKIDWFVNLEKLYLCKRKGYITDNDYDTMKNNLLSEIFA